MNKRTFFSLSCAAICALTTQDLGADYQLKKGKLVDERYAATASVQEHYGLMLKAIETQNWFQVAVQSRIIVENFPDTPFAQEALFHLGTALYYNKEFDQANKWLSAYLKNRLQTPLKYFEEALQYKFEIAEQFHAGAKRRLFGSEKMPKWLSGHNQAIEIYDEVIATLPAHPLAMKSLYSKASLLAEMQRYGDAVKAYQMLIDRFPKEKITPQAYVKIVQVYLEQLSHETNNHDILSLSQLNINKLRRNFPRSEEIVKTEHMLVQMKEIYAQGLYDTGNFYERKNRPESAIIYYQNAISKYGDAPVAKLCQLRLDALQQTNTLLPGSTEE